MLLASEDLARHLRTPARELLEHLLHQDLRSRGARGHTDDALAVEPLAVQVRGSVDEVAGDAGTLGELAQTVGIGAAAGTHHEQHIALLEELLHRVLAVLSRIADVLAARRGELREAGPQRRDHRRGVVHRQRRLRDERELQRVAHGERGDVVGVLNEVHAAAAGGVEAPQSPLDLRVTRVADEDHVAPVARVALHLHVHLGDQRAGGVEYGQPAYARLLHHRSGHPVRGEDDRGPLRHLAQLLDENRPETAQAIHHVAVVDDLVTHVDRRAEQLERTLDDVDGPIDTGAEDAWVGEQNLHQTFSLFVARLSRQASSSSSTAPIVIAESAMLNAGK